jgi:hypothetical protein
MRATNERLTCQSRLRHVNGDGLGQVDVLAGGDRVGRLGGVEERRGFNCHGLQLLLEEPAITGEAREAARRRNAKLVAHPVDTVGEVVGSREDVVAAMLPEQIGDPAAASAAADDAQVHFGTCAAGQFRSHHGEREGCRAGLREEVAAESRAPVTDRGRWWQ